MGGWLLAEGVADESALERIEAEVAGEVAAAAEYALAAPYPQPEEVGEDVYA